MTPDLFVDKPPQGTVVQHKIVNDLLADAVARSVVIEEVDTSAVGGAMIGMGWSLLCAKLGAVEAWKVVQGIVYP